MSEELTELQRAEMDALADWTPEKSHRRITLTMSVGDSDFWNELIKTVPKHSEGEGLRPDLLVLKTGADLKVHVGIKGEGKAPEVQTWKSLEFKVPVVFEPVEDTLGCVIAGTFFALELGELDSYFWRVREWLTTNNQRLGIGTAPEVLAEAFALEAPAHKSLAHRLPALPQRLPHYTFLEARISGTAITDGRDLNNWEPIEGALAMLHTVKDKRDRSSSLQTKFEPGAPLLGWWGKKSDMAEMADLETELKQLEFDALITYFVAIAAALEAGHVHTSIDNIIAAIGHDTDARRTKEARAMWRQKVWRWLLFFDSMAVIGMRPGTWREPRYNGEKREKMDPAQLQSRDALIKITGYRATGQQTLDNSAVPEEVSFVAGPWLDQWRGNREILSEFGNLRAIAAIPRGKPSGAWAACAGLVLHQRWREQAAKTATKRVGAGEKKALTQKFKPFTRRDLLLKMWRSDEDVMVILETKPARAKEYWNQAVKILQKAGIIGFYHEIEPLKTAGYGWQEEWLDQPLDIRPTGDNRKDAIKINAAATAARKKGRKTA